MTLSIKNALQNVTSYYAECRYAGCRIFYCYAECLNAECHYAEYRYVECCGATEIYIYLTNTLAYFVQPSSTKFYNNDAQLPNAR